MVIYAYRLSEEKKKLSQIEILGKFSVAVGNYSAHLFAYPDIEARLFNSIILFNNIVVDCYRDICGYISLGYFRQRDSDSTALRNIGVGLGHSLVAYRSALQGIAKLQVNDASLIADLDQSWEVLAEPIQTVCNFYVIFDLMLSLSTCGEFSGDFERC
ncbi:hypothetical protein Pfo_010311 [Paulownia fortunei]|nr:hypothetical protein Pfo_010311 [Paulownia fortunei]